MQKTLHIVQDHTDKETCKAMETGLRYVGEPETINKYLEEFVVDRQITEVMASQSRIGWNHFLFERISKHWAKMVKGDQTGANLILQRLVSKIFHANLEIWKTRNTLVHGNYEEVSKLEIERVHTLVEKMYKDIAPVEEERHQWIFHCSNEDRLRESYLLQVAWLDGVRRMFPGKYIEITDCIRGAKLTQREEEYIKAQAARYREIQ